MGRLTGLDALRGIAALIVAIQHAAFLAGEPPIFQRSFLAVDFFFLLSGFVLARTYEHRMPPAMSFLTMRFRRLWGPIAVGVLIGALFALNNGAPSDFVLLGLATGLLFLPMRDGEVALNVPAWSIFFEIFANVIHTLLLYWLSTRNLAVAIVVFAIVFLLTDANGGGHGAHFFEGVPRVLLSYSMGILLYRLNGDRARFPSWIGFVALPLLIALASSMQHIAFDMALIVVANPPILVAGLAGSSQVIARLLGAISFPLYAVHWPILQVTSAAGWGPLPGIGVSLMAALAVGYLTDRRFREELAAIGRVRAARSD